MTALCTCPHCQSEYHSYEYPLIDNNGKQHMIRKGFCPECGIYLSEIPSDYDEIAEARMQSEASALRFALGHDLRQFLDVFDLSMYPFFTVTDSEGRTHKAFSLEEAECVGYAYYQQGQRFTILRNGRFVKEVVVPYRLMDRYIIDMSYIIDGSRMSFRFGCPDERTLDRILAQNKHRPVDDLHYEVIPC